MISPEEKQAVIDLFPFMGERPVIFDIGSNKGDWADIVLEEYGERCDIHLFEPNEKLRSYTEIKYEYKTNIVYSKLPIYKDSTVLKFNYFENYNNELSSLYDAGNEWDGLPVMSKMMQTISVDDYCGMKGIGFVDYIKIDIEGADLDALFGANELIGGNKIGIIQIEYSEHWGRAKHTFIEMKNFIRKYGYNIYRYVEDNFWEVKEDNHPYDNYFITKFEIHNYCISGSNANFIMNTIDLPKMDLIGECGAMEGMTTKYMCEKLLNRDNPDARVIVVDPLYDYYVEDDPRYHPEFKHQYQRFKRNTRGLPVNLYRGESKDELPKLNALRCDMWFIDGNHYPDWPYHDGCWCFAMTKIGGYLLFDDYDLWAEDTKASIDKFLNEFSGAYEIVEKNYQVLIKKTSNRYNSLTYEYYK